MSGDSVRESRVSPLSVFRLCETERDLSASWRLLSCEVTSSNLLVRVVSDQCPYQSKQPLKNFRTSSAYCLVGTRLKFESIRQSKFLVLHLEQGAGNVFAESHPDYPHKLVNVGVTGMTVSIPSSACKKYTISID